MSYDINVVPRRPGQSWDEAEEAAEDAGGPLRPEQLVLWERLVGELTELIGRELHDFRDEDSAELSDEETGLQVSLYHGSAGISYPYWQHEDQAAFHRLVADTVATVCRLTGWQAYDSQTGDTFDGTPADEVGLRASAWIAGTPGGPAGPPDVYPRSRADQPAAMPWREVLPKASRRRFHLYFWFGAVILPPAVFRLASIGPQGTTVVPVVLSVFNLFMAWRIWSAMRRDGTW